MTIIRKSPHSPEYLAMPPDRITDVITDGPPKNGLVMTQKYVDAATAQMCEKEREPAEDERCGWGPVGPGWCQRFRNPRWILFWLSWAGAIQGMVVNGFVNVVISNIERRYDLSSTESGTIASCYDIASVLCLIPVSYFGGLGIKPRYLGIGVFIMGVGSIVFSLPQFTSGVYKVEDTGSETTCSSVDNRTHLECDENDLPESLSNYKYVFFLGQLLHGAGAAPLYTLGVTYLDENLPLRSSSFYVGIFYAMAIVGPAIGYLAGGFFLDFYVDFNTMGDGKLTLTPDSPLWVGAWWIGFLISAALAFMVALPIAGFPKKLSEQSLTLTPDSPRWVGAWWIGFLISAALAFMVALPIAGFPKKLPGSEKFRAEREKEVYSKKGRVKGEGECLKAEEAGAEVEVINYKQILKSVKVLVFNPTFMFLNLAAACEGNILSGFATFTPKFIESQFSLPASTAAQYVGYAAIPAGGGGTFLGGYLVKRFNLHVRGILRLCLGLMITVLLTTLVFLVNCGNGPFAGVSVQYGDTAQNSSISFYGPNLTASCNSDCHCSKDDYNPVCGVDGVLYYSPCYAGCRTEKQTTNSKVYTDCQCVVFDRQAVPGPDYEATEGKCTSSCNYLPFFMPIFGILMLLTFVASMPALSATLRCVPTEHRSFALGIQWIIARCLGSIPGPILFGKLIDITCTLWQSKCSEQGSCFFYDNHQMSNNMLAVSIVGKFLSALCFFCALMFYKVPNSEEEEEDNSHGDKEDSPPPPKSLSLSPTGNCKSNQSIHTAVTMLSDSTPTTPATPVGQANLARWSQL